MTPIKRIQTLEEAAARRVNIKPREPDDVDRLFESVDNLARELQRGDCVALLPELPGLASDDIAGRAQALAETVFARLAGAANIPEQVGIIHSYPAVSEAVLRAEEEWWGRRDPKQDEGGQFERKALPLPSAAELESGPGEVKAED